MEHSQFLSSRVPAMKKIFFVILSVGALAVSGCSRSDKPEASHVQPQSTPDAERLKSDAERLQQATANAAKEREKAAAQQQSPTPTATP